MPIRPSGMRSTTMYLKSLAKQRRSLMPRRIIIYLLKNKINKYQAIQFETESSGGFAEVMNIINGGYDCCPSSTYAHQYGHILHRYWWYLDIYHTWTGEYPVTSLDPIPIHNCPLAEGMNCQRLASGTCWSNCCSLNSMYPWVYAKEDQDLWSESFFGVIDRW